MLDFSSKNITIRQLVVLGTFNSEDDEKQCKIRLSLRCRLTQEEANDFDPALGVAFEEHMKRQSRNESGIDGHTLTIKAKFDTTRYDFGEGARAVIVDKICGQPKGHVADGHCELNWIIEVAVPFSVQGELARMVQAEDTMLSIVDRQLPLPLLEEEMQTTANNQEAMSSRYADWTMKQLRDKAKEIGMTSHGNLTKGPLIGRIIQCERHATSAPAAC